MELSPHKQLFIDNEVIAEMRGLTKCLNQPTKFAQNPVIRSDRPWEGAITYVYGTTIFDEEDGHFKMWYITYHNPSEGKGRFYICYAISEDGKIWDKPSLGAISFKGSLENNIVLPDGVIPSVIKDTNEPNPERRYKMLFWDVGPKEAKGPGAHLAFSPDGIHWTP